MSKTQNFTKAIIAAVAVYILWGFSFLASKAGQEYTTPFVLLAYRFDIAVLLLSIPVLLGRQKVRLRGKKIAPLLLLGTMEPCIYFIGEQYGIRLTNTAFSGVMVAVIPIVTLIAAALILKDRPTKAQWVFSLLSIGGVIAISLAENSSGGGLSTVGVLCLLLAVFAGSGYSVLSRGLSDEFSVFERTYIMQIMGALFYTALALIECGGDIAKITAPMQNADFVLAALYLSVGASVLGYTLFNYAVSNAPMANVMSLCNLTTVISVLAGVFILGEPFSVVSAAALAAVLVGIWGVQTFGPKQ